MSDPVGLRRLDVCALDLSAAPVQRVDPDPWSHSACNSAHAIWTRRLGATRFRSRNRSCSGSERRLTSSSPDVATLVIQLGRDNGHFFDFRRGGHRDHATSLRGRDFTPIRSRVPKRPACWNARQCPGRCDGILRSPARSDGSIDPTCSGANVCLGSGLRCGAARKRSEPSGSGPCCSLASSACRFPGRRRTPPRRSRLTGRGPATNRELD